MRNDMIDLHNVEKPDNGPSIFFPNSQLNAGAATAMKQRKTDLQELLERANGSDLQAQYELALCIGWSASTSMCRVQRTVWSGSKRSVLW